MPLSTKKCKKTGKSLITPEIILKVMMETPIDKQWTFTKEQREFINEEWDKKYTHYNPIINLFNKNNKYTINHKAYYIGIKQYD